MKLPPIDQIKLTLPNLNLPPLSPSSPRSKKSLPPLSPKFSSSAIKKTSKVLTKKPKTITDKVFVVIYVYLDDADEPQAKVFSRKGAAINYVENEIKKIEGQEGFEIDDNETDMSWNVDGAHWEITEQTIE